VPTPGLEPRQFSQSCLGGQSRPTELSGLKLDQKASYPDRICPVIISVPTGKLSNNALKKGHAYFTFQITILNHADILHYMDH
jgi:hypothetical protein